MPASDVAAEIGNGPPGPRRLPTRRDHRWPRRHPASRHRRWRRAAERDRVDVDRFAGDLAAGVSFSSPSASTVEASAAARGAAAPSASAPPAASTLRRWRLAVRRAGALGRRSPSVVAGSAIEVPELPSPPSAAGSEPAADPVPDRLRDLVEPVERVEEVEELDLRVEPEPVPRALWAVWDVWAPADCVSEAPRPPPPPPGSSPPPPGWCPRRSRGTCFVRDLPGGPGGCGTSPARLRPRSPPTQCLRSRPPAPRCRPQPSGWWYRSRRSSLRSPIARDEVDFSGAGGERR